MHRNDWVAIVLILGATICSIAMIVFGANGCTPNKNAEFAAEVSACEAALTCAAAVECRRMVAVKYNRPFTGHCEPLDGGK